MNSHRRQILAVVCVLTLLFSRTALLGDAMVTSTADGGPGTLRAAIITGGTITFDPSFSLSGHIITLTSALPGLTNGTNIVGPGASLLNVTRPSGGAAFRVFTVNTNAAVTISGLSISSGLAQGADGTNLSNAASAFGGGIYNGGTLTLRNCVLFGNQAKGGKGADGSFGFTGGAGRGGFGAMANGGAIYNENGATLHASDCTFSNNSATGGAGGANPQATGPGSPQLGGTGGDALGGAIYAPDTGSTIERCFAVQNSATSGAGGSDTASGGFGGDGGEVDGGALFVDGSVVNCTIVSNTAHPGKGGPGSGPANGGAGGFGGGGGISGDIAKVTNCTVTANHTDDGINGDGTTVDNPGFGGGVVLASTGNALNNNLISDNVASSSPDAAGEFKGDYNLIRNTNGWSFSPAAAHNITNSDPLLDPAGPQNNGGPTATIALKTGSTAINTGNDSTGAATDQRHFARNSVTDLGAFEVSSQPFAVTAISRSGANFSVTFPTTNTHGYTLQRSGALDMPNWGDLAGLNANSTSQASLVDTTSDMQPKFFYRVVTD